MSPAAAYTPPGGTATLYTYASKPALAAVGTDPDGNTVSYLVQVHSNTTGSALVSSCTAGPVASGTQAGCTVATALADNSTYYARFATKDDQGQTGPWSGWTTFKTAIAAPANPTISCPTPYTNGSWTTATPAANITCTVTATGTGTTAAAYIRVGVDGGTVSQTTITQSSNPAVAKVTVTVPKTAGAHRVDARVLGPAQVSSAGVAYTFGYGAASMTSPKVSPVTATTDTIRVSASGPPKDAAAAPQVTFHWRVAGSGQDEHTGWTNVATPLTVTDNGAAGLTAAYPQPWDLHAAIKAAGLNDRVPTLVEIQAVFRYTSANAYTWTQAKTTVQYLPHAFGNGFPQADTGGLPGGKVALWTGELAVSDTDATVAGYNGDLSIARSHGTYAGPASTVNGVFGPGWTANFDGPQAGAAGVAVYDGTRTDGTIALVDGDGSALVYQAPAVAGSARRTGANLTTGTYAPANDDTGTDGSTLVVSGTGTATTLTYTQDDGTVTTFTVTTAPTATTDAVFAPASVTEPAASSVKQAKTWFYRNAAGKVTNIVTAAPGITCPVTPGAAVTTRGCRGLLIEYATATTATATVPGDYTGQVKKVSTNLWDPSSNTAVSSPVAVYAYTTTGTLASVTDPRTGLTDRYSYDAPAGSGPRLTGYTPAGLQPFTVAYDSSTPARTASISRTNPSGTGSTRLAGYAYGVALSGEAQLPAIGTVASALGQAKTPTYAAAVFGADYQGAIPPAAGNPAWKNADLQYTDALGYTIDTASFGAGDWQYTATEYTEAGNPARSWDTRAVRAVLDGEVAPGPAATVTVYNPDITNSSGAVVTPAGTYVTDTFGPARYATIPDPASGVTDPGAPTVTALVRPRSHTDYDQGAPNAGVNPATGLPYRLPTTVTVTAVDLDVSIVDGQVAVVSPARDTLSVTRTGYDPAASPLTAGSANGWALGSPVTVSTDMGTGTPADDIVKATLYDDEGAITATKQPSGSAAGTRTTTVYSSAANAAVPECGNRPEWAGLVCQVGYGTPDAGPALPRTVTTYSTDLQPATVTDYSGATQVRATTTSYDGAGRAVKTAVTTAGAVPGSLPVADTGTVYDPATGLTTATTRLNTSGAVTGQDVTGYDSWGRQVSYAPDGQSPTTTSYDSAGRVGSVTDPKGVTSYGYDRNNPDGTPYERRGLTTTLTVTTTDGSLPALTSTGSYDAAGTLVAEVLPGGITRTTTTDQVGQPVALTYTGDLTDYTTGTDPDTGATTYTPGTVFHDQPWLGWTQQRDTLGRVAHEWTPVGAAFTDGPAAGTPGDTGDALAYERTYGYDRAGRLVLVNDRTAPVTGTAPDETTGAMPDVTCQTRRYTFDANGNRTSATRQDGTDTTCPAGTGTGAATTSWAYDSADRLTHGAGGAGDYSYDLLGRATTLPAVDTPNGAAAGNLTIGYYDTDAVASATQNGAVTGYTLDVTGRRATQSTQPVTGPPTSQSITRHYTDSSDNPAWVDTATPSGTTTTRYAETLGGDLGLSLTTGGTAPDVELTVGNPHGDTVTTIALPITGTGPTLAVGNATCIAGWSDYDEYGNPRTPAATTALTGATGGTGYGWVGTKQRATDPTSGLTLMGARLYNRSTGQFTSLDPEYGGNTTNYTYPQDPNNKSDLDGRWPSWLTWRNVGRAAAITAGVVGAVACGASIVCGIAVGAASAAGAYAFQHAGTSSWSRRGFAQATILGGAFGALGPIGARIQPRGFTWATSRFKSGGGGFTFGRRARGGMIKPYFGVHRHPNPTGHLWHYHRGLSNRTRSFHRPWQGGW